MKTSQELAWLTISDCCHPIDPEDGNVPFEYVCNHYLLEQRLTELFSSREYFFNRGKQFPNESFEDFMNTPIEWDINTDTYKLVRQ
jgi:hypothetical protein